MGGSAEAGSSISYDKDTGITTVTLDSTAAYQSDNTNPRIFKRIILKSNGGAGGTNPSLPGVYPILIEAWNSASNILDVQTIDITITTRTLSPAPTIIPVVYH